eukprot:6002738-Prorocentrum_lima.AAC.1
MTLDACLASLAAYRRNYGLLMNFQLELIPTYILQGKTPFPVPCNFAPKVSEEKWKAEKATLAPWFEVA